MNNQEQINSLKRTYGGLKFKHNRLKVKAHLKTKEILYLRRQLEMIEKKCRQILNRGEKYMK